MTILSLLLGIIVFGVLLYIVTLIPMNDIVRKVVVVVALAVLFLVLYVASFFGVSPVRLK